MDQKQTIRKTVSLLTRKRVKAQCVARSAHANANVHFLLTYQRLCYCHL